MEDLNGDGHDEIIVANLYAEHHNLYDAGSVYVYSGSNASMLFRFDGQEDFEYFGHSASSAGDVNGDGIADIVVGSSGFDGGAQYDDRGAVSIFSGADGSLLFNQIGAQVDDHYGYTVAGAGDVNANGFDDIIAGTPWREAAGHFAVGMANVIGLNPYLSANFDSVSAASGGALRMDLDFPTDRAFLDYKVLMSATGVGPTFFGVDIPLTQDALTVDTYYGNYPTPNHYNMHGTLNADGNSNATLTIPSGLPISLIGNTYYLAAIAFPQGLPPEISSVAISVTITP